MTVGEILGMLLTGLVIGALARWAIPGRVPIGCLGTIAVGVAGSFVGGFIGQAVVGGFERSGLLFLVFSVIGAILVLLFLRALGGRR